MKLTIDYIFSVFLITGGSKNYAEKSTSLQMEGD